MAVGRHVTKGEYQGKPMMIYGRDDKDRYPVQLGTRKLAAVVCNIKQTIKFLLEDGGEDGKEAVEEFQRHFTPVDKKAKKDKSSA